MDERSNQVGFNRAGRGIGFDVATFSGLDVLVLVEPLTDG